MKITKEQFQLQIDRLCDAFGDNRFPDQRVRMMWDSAEENDYGVVIGVVDSFIRGSKYAPLPSDFSLAIFEATIGTKKKFCLGEVQPEEIAKCKDCGDSGFIRLIRNQAFEEWAKWETGSAPCHCYRGKMAIDAAKRKPKNSTDLGPQFADFWRSSYSIISAY